MEGKTYKTLLKELRLFQLSLKQKRKMFFNIQLGVVGTDHCKNLEIITGDARVSIPGFEPFEVRRENFSDDGPFGIRIYILDLIHLKLKFESEEEKILFKNEISREWTPSPERES